MTGVWWWWWWIESCDRLFRYACFYYTHLQTPPRKTQSRRRCYSIIDYSLSLPCVLSSFFSYVCAFLSFQRTSCASVGFVLHSFRINNTKLMDHVRIGRRKKRKREQRNYSAADILFHSFLNIYKQNWLNVLRQLTWLKENEGERKKKTKKIEIFVCYWKRALYSNLSSQMKFNTYSFFLRLRSIKSFHDFLLFFFHSKLTQS